MQRVAARTRAYRKRENDQISMFARMEFTLHRVGKTTFRKRFGTRTDVGVVIYRVGRNS